MADDKRQVLGFDIDVDPRLAIAEIGRFQKGFVTRMKVAEKSTKALDKGMLKFVKQLQGASKQSKGVKELARNYKLLEASIKKDMKAIGEMAVRARAAKGDEKKRITEEIKGLKEATRLKNKKNAMKKIGQDIEDLKDTQVFDTKSLISGAEEAGNAMAEPLHEVFRKDAPALFKRAVGILAGGFNLLGKGVGRLAAPKEKKEGEKNAMAQTGAALKDMGGLSKGLGAVAGILAKIGPLLEMAGSFMMSFVKILFDAEAAAKDYNKQLLATSGTSEFLSRGFGSAAAGAEGLEKALNDARNGAMDLSMVQWGISKDTALAFQSALAAEGVSLGKLGDSFAGATGYATDHAKAIQMAVSYSRSFGVSLNEITQLQGKLMADMGLNATQVEESFQRISQGAAEAGMASSKFFGIVSSFSADLSLFALRMEDITKMMGKLNQVMDPKNAQKFLQALNQKFSGGVVDNMKHMVIAGPAGKKNMQGDMANKLGRLRTDLQGAKGPNNESLSAEAIDKLISIIKSPNYNPRDVAKWQAKQDVKLSGALVQEISENANAQKMVAAGDAASLASIAEQMGPMAKATEVMAEIRNVTKKGLNQLTGIDIAALEQSGVASAKEILGLKQMYGGLMGIQESLIERARKGTLTKDDQEMLGKLGVDSTKGPKDTATQLENIFKSDQDFKKTWDSMDKSQQTILENSAAEIDYNKQTASFQTSSMDRLGIIADILMNQIYGIMTDIWGTMIDMFGVMKFGNESAKEFQRAQLAATKSQSPELLKAFQDANGNLHQGGKNAIEGAGKNAIAKVQAAVKQYNDLKTKLASEKDDGVKHAIEDQMKMLEPALKYSGVTHGMMNEQSGHEGGVEGVTNLIGQMLNSTKGVGAAPTPASTAPPTAKEQKAVTTGVEEMHDTVHTDMRQTGVKIDRATVEGPFADAMEKSVYNGAAKALFEYYMYSSLDAKDVAASMSAGVSPTAIRQIASTGQNPSQALGALTAAATAAKPNAVGGTVTGIAGDMAKVSRFPPAPAGEGWASVGRGERISPAGGGGGGGPVKVELFLKPDLARFIHARVIDGHANFERNKRLR